MALDDPEVAHREARDQLEAHLKREETKPMKWWKRRRHRKAMKFLADLTRGN
jgi:hypothetical protein